VNRSLPAPIRARHIQRDLRRSVLSAVCAAVSSFAGAQNTDLIFADDFESCRAVTQPIYAVDESGALLRFDPTLLGGPNPIQSLGTPSCTPGASLTGTDPAVVVSMSVDRIGTVWVLYSSGELFTIDPASLACAATNFEPQQTGWNLFNLAFAGPGGPSTQSIYIDGGTIDLSTPGGFALIDRGSLRVQALGSLAGAADGSVALAGTGDLQLFGLYLAFASTSHIRQIDRTSGAILPTALTVSGVFDGNTVAWAFAHWGGKFWIFATRLDPVSSAQTTSLWSVDRVSGMQQMQIASVAYTPISAGSSTCVPVQPPP
jgi:hypothetical protein